MIYPKLFRLTMMIVSFMTKAPDRRDRDVAVLSKLPYLIYDDFDFGIEAEGRTARRCVERD
jgi:hypothetical protein